MTTTNNNPRVLAIDAAGKAGFAIGNVADSKPISGTERIAPPGSTSGYFYVKFVGWLNDLIKIDRPDVIFVEEPLDPRHMGGKTNMATIKRLITLAENVQLVAHAKGIFDVRYVPVADVRYHFIGKRNVRSEEAKRLTIRECTSLGWAPRDDNAADAMALWSYGVTNIRLSRITETHHGRLV